MLVLDTDHVGEYQKGTSAEAVGLKERLEVAIEPVATTIITVEEIMRGWLAAIHRDNDPRKQIRSYIRLQQLFAFFALWNILPWEEKAATKFDQLKQEKIRLGTMDLKIASIALVHDATLLSRNLRDFEKVPDLKVEDWLSS